MADADSITRLNAALEGRYRVERELGAGGMATVYLAEDIRHHRSVALKVLKPGLAVVVGAERFLAEIETTASLQHPHILPLFDSGEADGFLFYVMPRVEGESLRTRLDREHQLPVDKAVEIASKVASALDYAHRHGIIHRDIKPANILLHDGEPVVADFGIALAVSAGGGDRLTETGLSLGTPHYMSPEQATGDLSVGPATDIYGLGCVLYEMLVGDPPYTGSTPQAVLGKIITAEGPAVSEERASVPPNIEATIQKALEKIPADRFASASDFQDALADRAFRHGPRRAATAVSEKLWRRRAIVLGTVALLFGSGLVWALARPTEEATTKPIVRFSIPVGEDDGLFLGGAPDVRWGWPSATSLAISPDGASIAFTAWEEASDGEQRSRLYVRRLDDHRAELLNHTEGASNPFFSPDGAWIGFFTGPSLRRVPVEGGGVETVLPDARLDEGIAWGATWGDDGTIVYGGADGLYQVAATGGDARLVAEPDSLLHRLAQPEMLPGSAVALFHGLVRSYNPERAEIRAVELTTGRQTTLLTDAMHPRVDTGHLLFMRQGTLMAVGFDAERAVVVGEPVVVLEDVMQAVFMMNTREETGAAQVATSPAGHLAYVSGGTYPVLSNTALRIHPNGDTETLGVEPGDFTHFRVSPDGDRLAFNAWEGSSNAIYVHDLARGITQRLRVGYRRSPYLAWSPSGDSIAFGWSGGGFSPRIYGVPADGTGEPELLVPPEDHADQYLSSWSSDGDIAYVVFRGVDDGNYDIWVFSEQDGPTPFVVSDAAETEPSFSPDGRWIAYQSDETGRSEVYVRPYPGPGAAIRVSGNGGRDPLWSPDGTRIYFTRPPETAGRYVMMAADVRFVGGQMEVGRPFPALDPWPYITGNPRTHDIFPDGSFVAAIDTAAAAGENLSTRLRARHRVAAFRVVLNFADELEERLGN